MAMTQRVAERFIKACVRWARGGFHPDNSFFEYTRKDGEYSCKPSAAARHDRRLELARQALGERVYAVGLDEMNKLGLV